jgi:hypothetical protein
MEAKNLSSRQVEILKHAVGYGSKSPGYRNHFCAEIGSDDHATCLILEDAGLMEAGLRINGGRDQYFLVNRAGGEAVGLGKAAMKRLMEQ